MRVFMLLNPDGVSVKSFYTEDIFGEYPNDTYPSGVVEISADQWMDFRNHQGFRAWDPGTSTFVEVEPPGAADPTVTGNQWAFALSNLGLSAAWLAGVAKSKASDQTRINLISRTTPLLASDPLLARVCGKAGVDANGVALIDPAAVFASAQSQPL